MQIRKSDSHKLWSFASTSNNCRLRQNVPLRQNMQGGQTFCRMRQNMPLRQNMSYATDYAGATDYAVTDLRSLPLWRRGPNARTFHAILPTLPPSKATDMAHLYVPQNQALGVCRRFVPDIQICSTHGRERI